MMEMIIEHSKTVAIVAGGFTALFLAISQAHKFLLPYWNSYIKSMKARNAMPVLLQEIGETVKQIDSRVKKVEYEITPNSGSSMKDAMRIIRAEIEAANWLQPRPSFRTTSFGVNTFVNEAYCNLCGATSDELLKLNWKNFIYAPEEGDDYMRRWLESAKEYSQFVGDIKLKNTKEEYVGKWTCKIRPLGPLETDSNNYLWHGTLMPHDKVAIEYANKYNIPIK